MFERFTHENRTTLMFAMEEAHDLGHRELGNDHLLLGMLCNARGTGNEILQGLGLTLQGAREASRAIHETAAESAADNEQGAQGDDAVTDETVREDREALRAIGIDLDKVRSAVRDTFGEDITEGWGRRRGDRHRDADDEAARRREDSGSRGRRGRDHHVHDRHAHDHHEHEHRSHRGGPRGRGRGADLGGREFAESGEFRGGFDRRYGDGPFDGPWGGPGRGRRGPASRRGGFRRPRFAPEVRTALEGAVRTAREHDDQRLETEYLLLGILDAGDAASTAVIESASTPDALRAAVTKRLSRDESQSA